MPVAKQFGGITHAVHALRRKGDRVKSADILHRDLKPQFGSDLLGSTADLCDHRVENRLFRMPQIGGQRHMPRDDVA